MTCPQLHDSRHLFGLLTIANVLEKKRPAMSLVATRGPDQQPLIRSDLWL